MVTAAPPAWNELLETSAPRVSGAQAERFVYERFGIRAHAHLLHGERDRNFRMTCGDGTRLLLKITNSSEPRLVSNLQSEVLRYLNQWYPTLPVPRLSVALDGSDEAALELSDGKTHVVRLMSFLSGQSACSSRSEASMHAIAHALAALDLALCRFDHPAARHDLLWNVSRAERVRALASEIADRSTRALAADFLDLYEAQILPRMAGLRAQSIHNDLNPDNILLASSARGPRVTGIVDFGDLIHAPLVGEVATAAAYQILRTCHPLDALVAFASAYCAVLPLTDNELDVLFALVTARLVMLIAITEWRARSQVGDRDYILRNTAAAAQCLDALASISTSQAAAALRAGCRNDGR